MKLFMLITAFSMLVMAGASTSFSHSMGAPMTDNFNGAYPVISTTQMQVGCIDLLCQTNSMGDMSTGECLVHCLAAYSSQFGSNSAVLPASLMIMLMVLAIFLFFWSKKSEFGSNFDRRRFSNVFGKLFLHRTLATVVLRD